MTRIFTKTFYGEHENQYIDVTEDYDRIKKIIYRYAQNEFGDRFIEFHLAKRGRYINKPILIKLSSISEVLDISEEDIDD